MQGTSMRDHLAVPRMSRSNLFTSAFQSHVENLECISGLEPWCVAYVHKYTTDEMRNQRGKIQSDSGKGYLTERRSKIKTG
jgi:hypothetical protein